MKALLTFLGALLLCHAAYPAELFGTVDALSGSASVSDTSGKSNNISVGQKVYEGQTINTGADGEVHLVTEDSGIIAVRQDTVFRVDQYKAEGSSADKIFMSLFKGAIRSVTGWIGKHNSSAYLITTPNATIGIRGTDHETTVIDNADGDEPGSYDTVNEGSTVLKTPQGETEVTPGKFAFARKGRAVAPVLLERRPNFFAKRRLKIEGRIQQRKEFFHNRMEQMRDKRIQRLKTLRERHTPAHERGQEQKRRELQQQNQSQQAEQRREARRMTAERRREENNKTPQHVQRERRRAD